MTAGRNYFTIERDAFDKLFDYLKDDGYTPVGPTVRDGAIVYDELTSARDLPVGQRDHQEAGKYRLSAREDGALFGYVVGPHSWKKYLHPPRELFWSTQKGNGQGQTTHERKPAERYALIGVRPCELAALAVLDRVFLQGAFCHPAYAERRSGCFVVAVNCTEPGANCFCHSMDTGPGAEGGYDLCLTEIVGEGRHYFLADAGSDRGGELLQRWGVRASTGDEAAEAAGKMERAALHMGHWLDTTGLAAKLRAFPDHPRWDDVARRCLNCCNCTLVCPTCFCTTVEDTTDLSGERAERYRVWDSCFTLGFSYVHGGSVRSSAKSRYRQWLVHKLSSWHDQFNMSGCVGCGRCITWCPAGIDITEEARALASPPAPVGTVARERV